MTRPYRYHPLEDSFWTDEKWDADITLGLPSAEFEERGWMAWIFTNYRQRPCGIYRATDEQLAADSVLPLNKARTYLDTLSKRRWIVRDGNWIFVPGYWKRQAHNDGMMKAARAGVESCTSEIIRNAFLQYYPLHSQWLIDGSRTVNEPSKQIAPTEQSRAEQYHNTTEQSNTPQASAAALLNFWFETFLARNNRKPEVEGKRDMEAAKAILRGRSLEEARAIVLYHFEHPAPFYAERNLYGLHHIRKDCNQIIARMSDNGQPKVVGRMAGTMAALQEFASGRP